MSWDLKSNSQAILEAFSEHTDRAVQCDAYMNAPKLCKCDCHSMPEFALHPSHLQSLYLFLSFHEDGATRLTVTTSDG
eukprot:4483385-Amphidinium_carterae.1